jgi:hypothetical protein
MSGIQTNFRAEDMIGAAKPAAAPAPKAAKAAPAPKTEKVAPKIEKPVVEAAVAPVVEEKEVPVVEEVVEEAPVETEEAK